MAPNLAPVVGNHSNIAIRNGNRREANNSGASSSGSSGVGSAGSSTSSSSSGGNSNTKNSFIQKYLIDCKSIYSCIYCRTHLANHDELVSRSFQGNHGRAYLFNSVVNVTCGPAVERELNTGSHAVADIFCENCETTLGWKYEKAYVETQKYKEGKYIIELAHVVRENKHLELDKKQMFFDRTTNKFNPRFSNQQQKFNQNNNSLSPPSPPSSRWLTDSLPNSSDNNNNNSSNRNSSSSDYDCHNSTFSNQRDELLQEQDLDNDLMFVFYDDLSSNDPSSPSTLSSSHHNKYRRSLYLDSTPYDWKYYTTITTSSSATTPAYADSSNKIDHNSNDEEFYDCFTDHNMTTTTSC